MPKAIYISHDGSTQALELEPGVNLMHAAVSNGIYAIVGDCGGSASCATCHVYLDAAFEALVPPPDDREREMLGCVTAERKSNSRLSCQLVMEEGLDGITVHIAEQQW
jgi:2Fe-2S ferredoxin